MNERIRWSKLKQIAESIVKKEVEISGSTSLTSVRAGVVADKNKVEIILNLNVLKTVDDVINGISHELSHVILKTEDDNAILNLWLKLKQRIQKEYLR